MDLLDLVKFIFRSQEPEVRTGNRRTGNSGFWLLTSFFMIPNYHLALDNPEDRAIVKGAIIMSQISKCSEAPVLAGRRLIYNPAAKPWKFPYS